MIPLLAFSWREAATRSAAHKATENEVEIARMKSRT
jgi:hypothetical protein